MFFNFVRNSQHKRERDGVVTSVGGTTRHADPTVTAPSAATHLTDLLVQSQETTSTAAAAGGGGTHGQGTVDTQETSSQGIVASPTLFSCESHDATSPRETNNHSNTSESVAVSFRAATKSSAHTTSSPAMPSQPHNPLQSAIDVDAESEAESEARVGRTSAHTRGPVASMAALHTATTTNNAEEEDEQQQQQHERNVLTQAHGALVASSAESVLSDDENDDEDEDRSVLSDANRHGTTTATTSSADTEANGNDHNESSSTSSSTSSSSSGSSMSSSVSEDGADGRSSSSEDREKRYPRFNSHYASHFRHEMVPFLQACPIDRTFAPSTSKQPRWQHTLHALIVDEEPDTAVQLLLYGSFIYRRTLGKGTYSKVVLAERVSGGVGVPQVALKIFRDKDAYREACWDEVAVLQALCSPLPNNNNSSNNTNNSIQPLAGARVGGAHNTRTTNSMMTAATSSSYNGTAAEQCRPTYCPSVLGASGRPSAATMEYYSQHGHFMSLLEYIPHPVHPAIVFPVLGPSLLHVVRLIKRGSRAAVQHRRLGDQPHHDDPTTTTTTAAASAVLARDANEESDGGRQDERRTSSPRAAGGSYYSNNNTTNTNKGINNSLWRRGLPLPLLKSVLYQLLLFLRYIHGRGVVHTDLKPENVLFESQEALNHVVSIFRKARQTRLTQGEERVGSGLGPQRQGHAPLHHHHNNNNDPNNNSSNHTTMSSLSGLVMHSVHTASPNVHEIKEYHNQMKMNSAIALTKWQSGNAKAKSPQGAAAAQARNNAAVSQGDAPITSNSNNTTTTNNKSTADVAAALPSEARRSDTASSHVACDDIWRYDHEITVPMPLLNSVRVIDVGTAQFIANFTHRSHIDGSTPVSYDPIQTSHYRSPEVLMGVGWSSSADLFSLGCMIPELVTGDCLFMPKDTLEHLALMQHIIGPFRSASTQESKLYEARSPLGKNKAGHKRDVLSDVFACNGATYTHYFTMDNANLRWPMTASGLRQWERDKAAMKASDMANAHNHHDEEEDEDDELESLTITTAKDIKFVTEKPTLEEVLGFDAELLDLTRRMLCYDPIDRITAEEALQHPYFHCMDGYNT